MGTEHSQESHVAEEAESPSSFDYNDHIMFISTHVCSFYRTQDTGRTNRHLCLISQFHSMLSDDVAMTMGDLIKWGQHISYNPVLTKCGCPCLT